MKLELGKTGKDIITGFTGVIMAKAQYLTGCNQALLTPTELNKDGDRRDGSWFDEARIEVTDATVIVLNVPVENPGADEISAPIQ